MGVVMVRLPVIVVQVGWEVVMVGVAGGLGQGAINPITFGGHKFIGAMRGFIWVNVYLGILERFIQMLA